MRDGDWRKREQMTVERRDGERREEGKFIGRKADLGSLYLQVSVLNGGRSIDQRNDIKERGL